MEHVEILLVEDNPGDAAMTLYALRRSKLLNYLLHPEDGLLKDVAEQTVFIMLVECLHFENGI